MKELITLNHPCVEVAVSLPVDREFTYLLPPELEASMQPGLRVVVPFRNREITGYVVHVSCREELPRGIKKVLRVLDSQPVLDEGMLALTRWVSQSYGCSWGEAIENALPRWVKHGKSAEKAWQKEKESLPEAEEPRPPSFRFTLTPDQKTVYDSALAEMESDQPRPMLLHGVTGSGKSEIYIRLIHDVLARGRGAICLVPEIALTEQLKRFFEDHFGERLEVLHSKLTDRERFLAWKRLDSGTRSIVLGPRSAIFAPVKNLGLVIMDEEHENSYKQETVPRYHAREVGCWRAAREKALFLMGSATPSLESIENAREGNYRLLELTERVDHRSLPKVQIVDLRDVLRDTRKLPVISKPLENEIKANLSRQEGTMLLLNRRGFSTNISCPECGQIESCPSCHVAMTFHQEAGNLLCHYCNRIEPVPSVCTFCKSPMLRFGGFGTEKVESETARMFPQARIARLDTDTVRKRGSHEAILSGFRNREIDILVGTQMIAKGFDFPHVTLVGVILADIGLNLPDFRSAERTFQLLTQVAGRAGRGDLAGRVLIQTFSPDHPSVRCAQKHDCRRFYDQELPQREEHGYPPFSRLINIMIRAREEKKVTQAAWDLRKRITDSVKLEEAGGEILGPAPLPFVRLRGQFRWHLMVKMPPRGHLIAEIRSALLAYRKPSGVTLALDADPVSIL